jgi:hypothetical protein
MAYLSSEQLARMGFKALGKEVKISDRASIFEDSCTLAYDVKIFSQSDEYNGVTKSLIPKKYKNETFAAVHVHLIVGAGAVVFPDLALAEDCAMGAMPLVTKSTNVWDSAAGVSAK